MKWGARSTSRRFSPRVAGTARATRFSEPPRSNHPSSPKVLYARAAAYIQSKRKLDQAEALLDGYLAVANHA